MIIGAGGSFGAVLDATKPGQHFGEAVPSATEARLTIPVYVDSEFGSGFSTVGYNSIGDFITVCYCITTRLGQWQTVVRACYGSSVHDDIGSQ